MGIIFSIGHNELRTFFRNKPAYLWVFVLPLGFVYLMSLAAPTAGDPHNRDPLVAIVNNDQGTLGQVLVDELTAKSLKVTSLNEVKPGVGLSVITLPKNLSSNILQGVSSRIDIVQRGNVNEGDGAIVRARVALALVAFNAGLVEEILESGSAKALTESKVRARRAEADVVTLAPSFAGRNAVPTGFNFSLPGNLVMFMVLNLVVFGGSAMATDRDRGTISRMIAHQIRPATIVLGKVYGLMLVASLQVVVFMLLGRFLFHLNIGPNLGGIILVLLALAWAAGSLGVAVGSVMRSYDRVGAICVMLSMAMGVLGGCWFPLEFAPAIFKTLAWFTPTGWALKALHQLISFGSGFEAAIVPIAVLLVLGGVLDFLAIRLFHR